MDSPSFKQSYRLPNEPVFDAARHRREGGFLMQMSANFAQLRSCTVRPRVFCETPAKARSAFVPIRLANQMLMTVSGEEAAE